VYKRRYVVRLTHQEREHLEALVRRGKAHARKLLYARILLKTDASETGPAWTDERIAETPLRPTPTRSLARGGAFCRTGWRLR
jgi:hypothetical protein